MPIPHEPLIIQKVREVFETGIPYSQICKLLGMSKGQLAGIIDRYGLTRDPKFKEINQLNAYKVQMASKTQKEPTRLRAGSLGVIERQTLDKSRITLIAIPSLGEQQSKAYSYISRDQTIGR